jgi:hypothetical protein
MPTVEFGDARKMAKTDERGSVQCEFSIHQAAGSVASQLQHARQFYSTFESLDDSTFNRREISRPWYGPAAKTLAT